MADVDLLPAYRAIKARLKSVDFDPTTGRGLQAYDYVPGVNEWPGAVVLPPEIPDTEGADNGLLYLNIDIVVLVSGAIDEHQLKLLEYQSTRGARSISRAFAAEPTLGGVVGHIRITGSRPLNYEEQAGYQAFGCVFTARAMIG